MTIHQLQEILYTNQIRKNVANKIIYNMMNGIIGMFVFLILLLMNLSWGLTIYGCVCYLLFLDCTSIYKNYESKAEQQNQQQKDQYYLIKYYDEISLAVGKVLIILTLPGLLKYFIFSALYQTICYLTSTYFMIKYRKTIHTKNILHIVGNRIISFFLCG